MRINLSNDTSYDGRLVVRHDWSANVPHGRNWRLAWENVGTSGFVNAEGECSAKHYPTMRSAIADGVRRFGETAVRVSW